MSKLVSGTEPKDRILSAGVALFAANGYHATGVDELGHEAGLGRGALYYHMKSKETLLFEICRRNVSTLIHDANALAAEDLLPVERFHRLLRKLMRNIADNQQEWRIFFHDWGALTGNRLQTVLSLRERFEALVHSMLVDCITAGSFRPVDPLVTKGVLGFFNYAYLWFDPCGAQSPEAVADLFVDVLINGLRFDPNTA